MPAIFRALFLCAFPLLIFTSFRADKPVRRHDALTNAATNSTTLSFTFDYAATGPLLYPPNISGIIGDATDPAATAGIFVDVRENDVPLAFGDYSISVSPDNPAVIATGKIIIMKDNGRANIKIIPGGIGYCNITLTLHAGKRTAGLIINYASSAAGDFPAASFWHTGISDASAVVALDSNYMVIGDDEVNSLFVYDRHRSGLPVATFNYAPLIPLPDGNSEEIDCEAGTQSLRMPQRTYWTGSMSNTGRSYREQQNRDCLFAADITGRGAETKFSYAGAYLGLRSRLIKWGDANGYKLGAAAAEGRNAKAVNGFNVEGMAFAPDSSTLYIGFRAPLAPLADRTKALIAPIENFEDWFNDGKPGGEPVIGKPIELDLGGRGIRDIIRLSTGAYLIVAGSSDETLNAALFTWSGQRADTPVLVNNLPGFPFKAEAALEMQAGGKFNGKIALISDNGSTIFYNDGMQAKYLDKYFAKFRDVIIGLSPAASRQ